MNEQIARSRLGGVVHSDNCLSSHDPYILWDGDVNTIALDGEFEPDELEAIAWWTKNMKVKN